MFRIGAYETPSDFARRRFCGVKCAGIDLIATTTAASVKAPKAQPLAKPVAKPMQEPRKRNRPEPVVEIEVLEVEPTATVATSTRTWRTWARAKWEGPSEELHYAAERYGRLHRLTAEEVLRLWGYQKTEIVEVKKPKES